MYNTLLRCTYNNVSDVDQEDQYRIEYLNAFNLEEFDDKTINQEIDALFERVKHSRDLTKCMRKSAAGFGKSEYLGFGFLNYHQLIILLTGIEWLSKMLTNFD